MLIFRSKEYRSLWFCRSFHISLFFHRSSNKSMVLMGHANLLYQNFMIWAQKYIRLEEIGSLMLHKLACTHVYPLMGAFNFHQVSLYGERVMWNNNTHLPRHTTSTCVNIWVFNFPWSFFFLSYCFSLSSLIAVNFPEIFVTIVNY